MMNLYETECKYYEQLNAFAKDGGVILFGSTFAKNIPVSELLQSFELDCHLYNRSLTDLSIFDADRLLDSCVLSLSPSKVLIQLGETDLERGYRSISEILEQYEVLIRHIRSANKRCKIVLVSLCENGSGLYPDEFNTRLQALAARLSCDFADISSAAATESPAVRSFCLMKNFFRDRISEYDALHMLFA